MIDKDTTNNTTDW